MSTRTLLIVATEHLVCQLIADTLAAQLPNIKTEVARSLHEAEMRIFAATYDLALVSATLPNGDAFQLVQRIRRRSPATRIVVSGLPAAESIIVEYLEAGAAGYVQCNDPLEKLLATINAVAQDEALLAPSVTAAVMSRVVTLSERLQRVARSPNNLDSLTEREFEVLTLLSNGLTNREIAQQLTIEIGTVKNHVHNVLTKLNVRNRREAALYFSVQQKEAGRGSAKLGRVFEIQSMHSSAPAQRRFGSD